MSKLQKYPKYKDSGIEWIGEIPEHWEVLPIRAIFNERNEKNEGIKTDYILSVTKDRGVIPYDDKGNIGNKKSDDIEKYKIVYPNDFVINKMNVIIGSLGISKYYGAFSHVYLVYYPRALDINIKFYSYVFHDENFYRSLIKICTGIMELRESLNKNEFKKILMPFPPHDEQIQIANFLDKKTAQIDKFISIKEKLIKKLKEQRQIIINDAVTKGLNPNVKMKDSGIEWIGEIPEHWEVRKIKFNLELQNSKVQIKNKDILALENIESWTGKIIPTDQEYEGEGVVFKNGDILFGKLRPYLAKVHKAIKDGIAFGDLLVFRPKKILHNQFVFYIMSSYRFIHYVNSSTYGTKMPRVSPDYIRNIFIPIPPRDEQIQIINYLDKKTTQIDKAIKLQEEQIKKLKEYKTSLIDSVVTGKILIKGELDAY